MDIMDIRDIMDIMDIMDSMDIMNIMDITAWMAMAGAVSALVIILSENIWPHWTQSWDISSVWYLWCL